MSPMRSAIDRWHLFIIFRDHPRPYAKGRAVAECTVMSARESLIDELEGAVECGSTARREEVVRRITELFLGVERSSEEQIALHDDIIARLIAHIGKRALAELSERLAAAERAPPNAIQLLALNEEINVAGPVLALSNRVSDPTLIAAARTRSQAHLLAISSRAQLNEPVTDV